MGRFSICPLPPHAGINRSSENYLQLFQFSCEKRNVKFFTPFDVRLLADNKPDDDINNVVQPDLSIVCNKEKLDDKGCNGAPDMIIEVLSPSSVKLDRWKKYQLYEKAGVNEYWLVDPINNSVEIHLLVDAQYKFQGVFTKDDTVSVNLFPGFKLDLNQVFV